LLTLQNLNFKQILIKMDKHLGFLTRNFEYRNGSSQK